MAAPQLELIPHALLSPRMQMHAPRAQADLIVVTHSAARYRSASSPDAAAAANGPSSSIQLIVLPTYSM